jgi:hypothetical protein
MIGRWLISLGFAALVSAAMSAAAQSGPEPPLPTIGFYTSGAATWPEAAIEVITGSLSRVASPVRLDADQLASIDPETYPLVVVADAARVPIELPEALAKYAERGGHLALLGGPFFHEPLWRYKDRTLNHGQLAEAVAQDIRPSVLLDFESAGARWRNHTDRHPSRSAAARIEGGAAGTRWALKLDVSTEAGWDTFESPPLEPIDDPAAVLTTFWAKADRPGGELVVEWRERDGSRWMATIRLTDRWRQYILPVEALRYWPDPRIPSRGGPGDRFHPERLASIALGLAHSHTLLPAEEGRRAIWIDQIALAAPPAELRRPADLADGGMDVPVIETASPGYKLIPVTNAAALRINSALGVAGANLPLVQHIHAPTPRPEGTGLDRGRPWRFVALVESLDEKGRAQAAPASLLIPEAGGIVLSAPTGDSGFFTQSVASEWLKAVIARMIDGVFLYEGGAKFYVAFEGEEMPVGAVVINRGREPARVRVEVAVEDARGREAYRRGWNLELVPGERRRVADLWRVPAGSGDRFRVAARLLRADRAIDGIEHGLRVWRPKQSPEFIQARGGDFYLGDRLWRAHGVNYMPSSGAACEDNEFFEYWLDGRAYGPEIVDRDLVNLKDLGLNSVSAFVYHRSHGSRNLLDFLIRCEGHGLKVNLSLRPGTPMDFQWAKIREMIEANRLAENDTIMAYDLAWEPLWGDQAARRRFDGQWRRWIEQRYGSVEKAEAAWGCPAPREGRQIAGPSDEQVSGDGPWRKMVIDYRQFQNELLDEAYRRARDLVRTVDAHHLVSFRMTIAGDPTSPPARMAYDPAGLSGAVDIMEPEGYGRIGDWERVRPGWFTVAYCRAVAPQLPVIWSEFGHSAWDANLGRASGDRLEFAGRFYDDFYRMAWLSGSSGTFCWFSCGGYRFNERSDFGILAPDGSLRPQAEAIRRWAAKMIESRPRPAIDHWIPIRLGCDADGVAGVYRRVEREFWAAVAEGRNPGLRVDPQPAPTGGDQAEVLAEPIE